MIIIFYTIIVSLLVIKYKIPFTKHLNSNIENIDANIAVIIPCIPSHIKHLKKCIESINNQTLKPKQIIITLSDMTTEFKNDFGDDIIIDIVDYKQYAGENRNRGYKHLNNDIEYVCFFDADDIMINTKLNDSVYFMKKYNSDALLHSYGNKAINTKYIKVLDNNYIKKKHKINTKNKYHFENALLYLSKYNVQRGHIIVTKKIFNDIKYTSFKRGQDHQFISDIIKSNYKIMFINKVLSIYSMENSSSNDKVTAIILNYNRPNNIEQMVSALVNYNNIDEIIISHGKKDTEILIDHPKVINETTIRNKYYGASRYPLIESSSNDIILLLDDDMYPTKYLLNKMIKYYKKYGMNNFYGPHKRTCDKNGYTNKLLSYNIILQGLSLINKQTGIKIWNDMKNNQHFQTVMNNKGNGEDLLFSYLIKKNGGKNIYVKGIYKELYNKNGYSSDKNHYKIRSKFCKALNKKS